MLELHPQIIKDKAIVADDWSVLRLDETESPETVEVPEGKIIGPSFSALQMPEVIDRLLQVYVRDRFEGERFVDTAQRLGVAPFKEFVYATPIAAGNLVGEDHYA